MALLPLVPGTIKFLNMHFRKNIVERYVADNTKSIGNDTEFIGITEVTIGVHLLYRLIGCSVSWHGTISCFVRIIGIIEVAGFFKSL